MVVPHAPVPQYYEIQHVYTNFKQLYMSNEKLVGWFENQFRVALVDEQMLLLQDAVR